MSPRGHRGTNSGNPFCCNVLVVPVLCHVEIIVSSNPNNTLILKDNGSDTKTTKDIKIIRGGSHRAHIQLQSFEFESIQNQSTYSTLITQLSFCGKL